MTSLIIGTGTKPVSEGVERFFKGTLTDVDIIAVKEQLVWPSVRTPVKSGSQLYFSFPQCEGATVYFLDKVYITMDVKFMKSDGSEIPSSYKPKPVKGKGKKSQPESDSDDESSAVESYVDDDDSDYDEEPLPKRHKTRSKAPMPSTSKGRGRGGKRGGGKGGKGKGKGKGKKNKPESEVENYDENKIPNFAMVNNSMNSLFRDITLQIGSNNLELHGVGSATTNHAYLSFLKKMTSLDGLALKTWGNTAGWQNDAYSLIDNVGKNPGFIERKKFFFDGVTPANNKYTFVGKLEHPLSECPIPLPFGVKGKFVIEFNEESFFLNKDPLDELDYIVEISDVEIKMPYGYLEMSLYKSLLQAWQSRKEVLLPYRRFHLSEESIAPGKTTYSTTLSRIGSEIPCRIILFFVDKTRQSDVTKTPYYFARSFQNVYLTDAVLSLDNNRLDCMRTKMSERDCMEWYRRLQLVCGTDQTPASMNITYEDFKTGMFLMAFDLSHQKMAYDTQLRPVTTSKVLNFELNFSSALPSEILLYAIMELPATLKINYERRVFASFTPS